MQIPFLRFDSMNQAFRAEAIASFEAFFDSNWYVLGEQVRTFEKAYSEYSDCQFTIGVANGLDALHLSLLALDIGEGDEVIVPSNTYIASWLAVSYTGATPVPVEPNVDTCNINPNLIEAAITPKTKAIMPVHLYGQACEMEVIMAIAKKYGLYVVEDNAQSQGAEVNCKKTGSFGDVNGVSFYPGKNLGALGDAGAITTDNEVLAKKLFTLRNYGSQVKYYNEVIGYNSRLDELQAGILQIKLQHLDNWNAERQVLAQKYNSGLANISGLKLPVVAKNSSHVYHIYAVRCNKRDELQAFLKTQGIGTLIHYPIPPHCQKAYAHLNFEKGHFPIAEQIAKEILSLPLYPGLTDKEVDYIIEAVNRFFNH